MFDNLRTILLPSHTSVIDDPLPNEHANLMIFPTSTLKNNVVPRNPYVPQSDSSEWKPQTRHRFKVLRGFFLEQGVFPFRNEPFTVGDVSR
jgi:hypothetical protein